MSEYDFKNNVKWKHRNIGSSAWSRDDTGYNVYNQECNGKDSVDASLGDLLIRDGTNILHKTSKWSVDGIIKEFLDGVRLLVKL